MKAIRKIHMESPSREENDQVRICAPERVREDGGRGGEISRAEIFDGDERFRPHIGHPNPGD